MTWGAPKYKVLHNFGSSKDGTLPYGPLLLDAKGDLYGVTATGGGSGCGGYGCGTVFGLTGKSNGKWTETVLHAFADNGDGAIPESNLVSDAQGNLYGTTKGDVGGPAVFELMPGSGGWDLSLIYTKGNNPGLLLGQTDILYGSIGPGGIGELSPGSKGWTYTDLYDFCGPGLEWGGDQSPTTCRDGNLMESPLNWDAQGNLYGTTLYGGDMHCDGGWGCGVAFQMTPNGDGTWTYHVLHRFGSFKQDGQLPAAGLVLDAAGNAYGVTWSGGQYNCGNIFELVPSDGRWKETVLYNFRGTEGCGPLYTLAFDAAGALYGMAQGGDKKCGPCGVIFKLARQKSGKWKYSVLHTFHGPEGADPYGVILDGNGNIFGTAEEGGKYNLGVAFEITQ